MGAKENGIVHYAAAALSQSPPADWVLANSNWTDKARARARRACRTFWMRAVCGNGAGADAVGTISVRGARGAPTWRLSWGLDADHYWV